MFDPISLGLGGLGLIRGLVQNNKANDIENSSRQLAADTARYSPWTGMAPQAIQRNQGTAFGSALGGGLQGAAAGSMFGGLGAAPDATTLGAAGGNVMQNQIQNVKNPWGQMQQQGIMQRPSFFGNPIV